MGPGFVSRGGWRQLLDQVALGVRAPGTEGHAAAARLLEDRLAELAARAGHLGAPARQSWKIQLHGEQVTLTNVLTRIRGTDPEAPVTLLGSHYDARWIADRDPDPGRRCEPIPAANDGGSGTAVMMEMARALAEHPPHGDVVLAFFDGEDLGGVEDLPYAVGSRRFAEERPTDFWPDRVIALDMVGGRGLRLNIEGNGLVDPAGRKLFVDVFQRGRRAGRSAFFENEVRWIYSDHGPFLDIGMPAICLIDIDYPEWHTHADLPSACEPEGLEQVGSTLLEVLRAPAALPDVPQSSESS